MGLQSRSCQLVLLMMVVLLVPAAHAQGDNTTTTTPAPGSCNTDPCVLSCAGCNSGEEVADPENCRGFYVCQEGTEDGYYDLSFECDDGQVFNATTHECVTGDDCKPCGTTPSTSCPYECAVMNDGADGVPSPSDCHSYYTCDGNKTDEYMTCSATAPFFDGTKCQTEETRCCHCHAYCYSTDAPGLIADPLDCRNYYLCTAADKAQAPTISGTCPDGHFDPILQGCSDSAPCDTECTNVLGADGCIEPFTCETTGYFARCPGQCTPDYYHCEVASGEYQDVASCGSGVFHPDSHSCVSPNDCP